MEGIGGGPVRCKAQEIRGQAAQARETHTRWMNGKGRGQQQALELLILKSA